jgi:polysaccharide export outer membrane protein
LVASGAFAADSPQLGSGDVILIRVLGNQDLSLQLAVQAGGEIALPLLGRVTAEGLTPAALEDELERLIAEKEIDSHPDVSIEVTRWRDVIVSGAVRAPGGVAWQPGLTAAAAAALAGGERPDLTGLLGESLSALQAIESQAALEGRLRSLSAAEARLTAEIPFLASADFPDVSRPDPVIAFPATVMGESFTDLRKTQSDILASSIVLERARHASLLQRRDAVDSQIVALEGRVDALERQEALIAEEQQGLATLESSRLVPKPRLLEIKRDSADVAADRLEAIAELADARRERAEIGLSIDTFGQSLTRDLSTELADLRSERAEIEGRMPASRQAAALAAEQAPDLDRSAGDERFTIVRTIAGGVDIHPGSENEVLLPGDQLRVGRPAGEGIRGAWVKGDQAAEAKD